MLGTTPEGTAVTTRITFIYENPNDPATFETDNPHLLAMARAIPGYQGMQVSRTRPTATTPRRHLTTPHHLSRQGLEP